MKKFLSLLLALVMALGTVSALAEALPVEEEAALPAVGNIVNGFEVLEIRHFAMIGADVVLFEHQKTGAKLTYVANEDTNRVFQLTFLTRPIDNTGLPHVFEHSTLSGSEKYPSASLFMNLSYQTYNTYMNAYTADAMTCYPIASLSEAQLLKYADFYTDSCLHPNVLEDESIYRTEAWRYRMASMDDDLTLEGTVYTEMLGATTLSRAALLNANQATFPGAALTFDQGGAPDFIPEMTWEDLKAYHSLFYHPSNCMAYLYGEFEDYAAFLALLDEAFSEYEKADFHYEDTEYAPITAPVESKVGFPMAEGTDPNNQSFVYYYILCPGMKGNVEQELVIDNLCSLLNEDSSVLKQNLKKALPAASFSFGREVAAPDDAIVFVAGYVNEDDAPLFKETVDASLRQIAEEGFSEEMMDSVVASLRLSTKLAPESADPVEGILESFAYSYATTGDPFHYMVSLDSMDNMTQWNEDGTFKAAASQWLVDPELYTLTTTYPAVGQKEVHDAALAEYLAQVKANMTEEEKQAIIDFTNAAPADDDASELVAQLQAVTVESLPEEVKTYPISDVTGEDGIRRINVTAGVDGIGQVGLYLDAQSLPQEYIHAMRLFTRLLGQLDTDKHTKEELDVLMTRYLYNRTIGVSVNTTQDEDGYHPYLVMEWIAADEDLAAGYDLMEELVFHTQFTDTQKLLERVQAQISSVRSTINGSPYNVAMFRGFGVDVPMWRYYSYLNYLEYYSFLEDVEAALNENPEEVARMLQIVQAFFANNAGAIATFAGNEESIALNQPLSDEFLGKLDYQPREPMEYDLPVPSKNEALIVDTNIQFNNIFASFEALGMEDFDAGLNVVTTLVTDAYLIPILRDQYGVYTPWNGEVQERGLYLISYRDPNVAETFEVYAALPEMIAELEIDQETLDGYILNNYSSLAMPTGELAGAVSAITTTIAGLPQDYILEYMRQLKEVTPETVKAAAELYQKAWDNGVHSTAGSAAAINANADLYDVILNPFGAVDASQVTLNDVTEDSEYYEAVRFVFENGLMAANAEDAFGVDDPANVGDLVGALYVMIGGSPNAPEEAVEYLGQFGIVPEGAEASTILTNGMSDQIFVNFGAAIGLPLEADAPNETTDQPISRGALADQIQMLMMYLQ